MHRNRFFHPIGFSGHRKRPRQFRLAAFTIAESAFTLSAIAIAAVAIYASMTRINDYASTNRLNTCATSIVQDQIDRFLSESPFSYYMGTTGSANQIPIDLTTTAGTNTVVDIYDDPDAVISGTTAAQADLSGTSALAYSMVTGTMTSVVSDTTVQSSGANAGITGANLTIFLKKIDVTLNYKFRGRTYQVRMNALRVPNKI